MKLYELYGGDDNDRRVVFGSRSATLRQVRLGLQSLQPMDSSGDSFWLVTSNSGVVQLYIRGCVSGSVLYMYELHCMTREVEFNQWKALMRELKVQHLDLSVSPTDRTHLGLYAELGFEPVSQRVEVTVDPEIELLFDEDVIQIESLTLEQTGSLCKLLQSRMHTSTASEMLSELSKGFVSGVAGLRDGRVFSCLLYKEFTKSLVGEQCCCDSDDPTEYAREFSRLHNALLLLGQSSKKNINIGLAFNYTPPEREGVQYRVLTHHYVLR